MDEKVKAFLAGANDQAVVDDLYDKLTTASGKKSPEAETFMEAWDTSGWISSSGFEILFEQERPFEDWIKIFERVGFVEALPILDNVRLIVPDAVYIDGYTDKSGEFISEKFEELKTCAYQFYALHDALMARVSDYLREHSEQFFS